MLSSDNKRLAVRLLFLLVMVATLLLDVGDSMKQLDEAVKYAGLNPTECTPAFGA